jgi:hypothetical protein
VNQWYSRVHIYFRITPIATGEKQERHQKGRCKERNEQQEKETEEMIAEWVWTCAVF